MTLKNVLKLLLAIFVTQFVGFIGAIFTTPSIKTWYSTLKKPPFNPPNYIFAPVWILLYLLMGISLYLILDSDFKKRGHKLALIVFSFQLILNIFWSIIFFSLHLPFYAFLEIILLWFFILLTIIVFYRLNKIAAFLLIPYLLWVSFALILNFSIFRLNRLKPEIDQGKKEVTEIPKDKEICEKHHGQWGRIGLSPFESCNLPTSDTGKECFDAKDCEGVCLAELSDTDIKNGSVKTKGKCSSQRFVFGCQAYVQNGQAQFMCVD